MSWCVTATVTSGFFGEHHGGAWRSEVDVVDWCFGDFVSRLDRDRDSCNYDSCPRLPLPYAICIIPIRMPESQRAPTWQYPHARSGARARSR